jgi:hypothetical protein
MNMLRFRNFIFVICLTISLCGYSQSVDTKAGNSQKASGQVAAGTNSGLQKTKNYAPKLRTDLVNTIKETSGLVLFNGQLWTINDGGNPAEIYQIDTVSGKVLRTVVIRDAVNTDWESITHDDKYVYIGDCGNNFGNRTDLHVLKISKTDLLNFSNDTVKAGYIRFTFSDQGDISKPSRKTNFDCEAMMFHHDSLHLFSKDWVDLQTRHYILPTDTGTYQARVTERYNVDALITDAAVNQKGDVVLTGYKKTMKDMYPCILWVLYDYKGSDYFSGNKRRIELGTALELGQTEGVVLENNNIGWLSAESILEGIINRPAKLFRLDLRKFY